MTVTANSDDEQIVHAAIGAYHREAGGGAALPVDRELCEVRRDDELGVRVRLADRDDVTIAIYELRGRRLVPRGLTR